MPEPAGALPALPAYYGATGWVDERVLLGDLAIIALSGGRSIALAPRDYVRTIGARIAAFTGTTRLLPEGGIVDDGA